MNLSIINEWTHRQRSCEKISSENRLVHSKISQFNSHKVKSTLPSTHFRTTYGLNLMKWISENSPKASVALCNAAMESVSFIVHLFHHHIQTHVSSFISADAMSEHKNSVDASNGRHIHRQRYRREIGKWSLYFGLASAHSRYAVCNPNHITVRARSPTRSIVIPMNGFNWIV